MTSPARTIPFGEVRPTQRIFSPQSYRSIRSGPVFSLAHVEAMPMARSFPVVWQPRGGVLSLVVVRSFLRDPLSDAPARSLSRPSELPLIARAHPFVLSRETPSGEAGLVFVDELADEPTDAGAPVFGSDGRLSAGTEQRLRALALLEQDASRTEAMTQDLAAADCFVEWSLPFAADLSQSIVPLPLMVLRPTIPPKLLRSLVQRHSQPVVSLIGAHRLSLFRAAPLIKSAEQDISRQRADA